MRSSGRLDSEAHPALKAASAPMVHNILMAPRGYRTGGPCAEAGDVVRSVAMAGDLFQVLSDCPDCRVASAVVELIDPGRAGGTAIDAHCRLCGRQEQMGVCTQAGADLRDAAAARAAISAWALAEQEPDSEAFCRNNLGGLSLAEVVECLGAGAPVDTSFDAIAYLFPGMAGAAGAPGYSADEADEAQAESPYESHPTLDVPLEALSPTVSLGQGPAIAARALVAVMQADGQTRPGERRFIDAFLAQAGLVPLAESDFRHWRPVDLGIPEAPRPIIDAMVELAHIDGQLDGAEWQVIREFARHWGEDLGPLEQRKAELSGRGDTGMARLWKNLRSIFMTEQT